MILYVLLQMTMPMSSTPMPTVDTSRSNETLVELPPITTHHFRIPASDMAASTIAYCKRTGQTRCRNSVSAFSGGACIEVWLSHGRWYWVNCPQKPQ